MNELNSNLKPFARRVRVLRAWRGAALGLLFGASVSAIWAVIDWIGFWLTEWSWLGIICASGLVLGAVVGAFWKVKPSDVALAVDSRAGLKDRLGTAIERQASDAGADEAVRRDALDNVKRLEPKRVFPLRVGRWQYTALGAAALASSIFLMGSSAILLTEDGRELAAELSKKADAIERVAKPLEDPEGPMEATPEEKALAKEMRDFAKRLRRAKMTEEEGLQKANELAEKARELAKERVQNAEQAMQTAQQSAAMKSLDEQGLTNEDMEKLKLDAAQQDLLEEMMENLNIDPSSLENSQNALSQESLSQMGLDDLSDMLMNMSPEERQRLAEMINQMMQDMQNQADSGQPMSEADQEMLENLQDLQQALNISEEARNAIQEFMNSPEFQELMKTVESFRQAASQVQGGEPLTPEQIAELERQMEELAEALKDPEMREQILEQLRKALEQMKQGSEACEAGGT
jgi:DNA repair exonuclease SbcCD ATPase subunit